MNTCTPYFNSTGETMKSKCCDAVLVPLKIEEGAIRPLCFCSKCGLVYKKIRKSLKPEEEIDEWE